MLQSSEYSPESTRSVFSLDLTRKSKALFRSVFVQDWGGLFYLSNGDSLEVSQLESSHFGTGNSEHFSNLHFSSGIRICFVQYCWLTIFEHRPIFENKTQCLKITKKSHSSNKFWIATFFLNESSKSRKIRILTIFVKKFVKLHCFSF